MKKGVSSKMFFGDPATLLLSVIVCLCLISLLYGWSGADSNNFPPGPKPLPIIGNLHILNLKKPYKTFLELYKKYGSVFSIQIGFQKIVILCGYDTVKEALVNHADEFSERPNIPLFEEISKGSGNFFKIV
ncbi:cytochrome P450 2K6 [Bombina bombina]|uniref:cytochrome P450 2K6 n=1 Tax=Bombina bombina TaxID=8345 RepID=UPI00235A4D91|nr:cytochrome P450 2K6 [Bombina bombina]